MIVDRLIESKLKNNSDDQVLDLTLRPLTLADYVGQTRIKNQLDILMQAAKVRKESLEHVLFYGPPGLGKTTLAYILAHELGVNIKITSGPALERAGDLAAILTNLQDKDILFIDEIHRLPKTTEEILYPALEDFALDLVIGKGPGAKILRLDLPHFTIIGATTKISLLGAPLRDRFGVTYHFNFYELFELVDIIKHSAKILNVNIDTESAEEIAKRSRKTPRIANRLLKRVRDYVTVKVDGQISPDITRDALTLLEIDQYGLDATDRLILETIIKKFKGGPVGLNTISAAISEEMATVEDIYEPFLLQLGFLHRTPKGRIATDLAYKYLGVL